MHLPAAKRESLDQYKIRRKPLQTAQQLSAPRAQEVLVRRFADTIHKPAETAVASLQHG
jgi:hypothetical protein